MTIMNLKPICTSVLLAFVSAVEARATIEQQVAAILQEKCASCHEGDEEPELTKATDLSALRLNAEYVKAGDSAGSPLFQLLNLPEGDKKRMPKSKPSKIQPPLSADEKAVIAQWIDGPADVVARAFVTEAQIFQAILTDLQQLGPRATGVRYVSLANLYNESDARGNPLRSDVTMDHYRTAVTKMFNSLSWKPAITAAESIDAAKIVLRVRLEDYGLSPELWKKMVSAYPYRVNSNLAPASEAEKILGVLPVMRADYVVFALAQPPLYHEALGIPGGQKQRAADVALEAKLGIDYDKAILSPDAVRAGFQNSGVSQGNRLIERLPRPDSGYFWKSYDFDPTRQNDRGADLFRTPLGPPNGQLTKNPDMKFLHDGGEIVFSLPNGLQGYMLTDGRGLRLDEAPLNVVTDSSRKDSRIINGISCMSCHREGIFMTKVNDEVLNSSANLKLDPEDKATIIRLHEKAKLERFFQADSAQFAKAAAQCGAAGEKEPVSMLYDHFRDALTMTALAGEMADSSPDLMDRLQASENESVKATAAKFKSGAPVPRLDFEKVFPLFVAELSLGQVPARDRIAFTEFGGNIDTKQTIVDEGSAGVTVRLKDRKVKDQRVIDAEQPPMDAPSGEASSSGGIHVTRHPPGTRPGMVRIESPRKVIRIMPDGSAAPPEGMPTASESAAGASEKPAASAPITAAMPPTTGHRVFKIVTPQLGEDDFNAAAPAAPTVKPAAPLPSAPASAPAEVPPAAK